MKTRTLKTAIKETDKKKITYGSVLLCSHYI